MLATNICLSVLSKGELNFTSKVLFVLEIIKFYFLRYLIIIKFMMSSNAQAWNTKHILLINLRGKHSLVMILDQFMQYCKRKFFIKKFYKKCGLETSFRYFLISKKMLCEKGYEEERQLIWTNFGSFAITYLI